MPHPAPDFNPLARLSPRIASPSRFFAEFSCATPGTLYSPPLFCRLRRTDRGVAQPGRALGSGPRSRWFKSSRPDHFVGQQNPCVFRGFIVFPRYPRPPHPASFHPDIPTAAGELFGETHIPPLSGGVFRPSPTRPAPGDTRESQPRSPLFHSLPRRTHSNPSSPRGRRRRRPPGNTSSQLGVPLD